MTRKDYKAIAEVVAVAIRRTPEQGREVLQMMAEDLAQIMARDNERFDRTRFLEACGL